MDLVKLEKDINDKHLIRTHGFPFLMPLIKGMYKDGKNTQEVTDSIRVMISNHVEAKHDKIMETIGYYAKKQDLKRAFLSMIERDFIKVGLPREEIALRAFKKANKAILWSGEVDLEIEKQGIDITGNGYALGISVKGPTFDSSWDYNKHVQQLKNNKFKKCYIAFVDENTSRVRLAKIEKD